MKNEQKKNTELGWLVGGSGGASWRWEQLVALLIDRQWQLINARSKDIGLLPHPVVIQFVHTKSNCVFFASLFSTLNRPALSLYRLPDFLILLQLNRRWAWMCPEKTGFNDDTGNFSHKRNTQTHSKRKKWMGKQLMPCLLQKEREKKTEDLHGCQIANCPIERQEKTLFFFQTAYFFSFSPLSACNSISKNAIQLPILWYIKLNIRSLTPAELHYYLRMFLECCA